jgi:CRISPR/Cas system-associated exonuclease Cas4 (RecB family)
MKGFLEQVAIYLHRVYGKELHRFCIVFPNIRAGLFFRKYLAQRSEKPVWAPAFRSLDSLMEEITSLTQADSLSLIFDLFQAFKQHKPTGESFEEFYFWGEMLLDDFDDVDKNLVDARDLFRNVSDLKEIDQLFDYLTEEQKNAIRVFWQDFNGGNNGALKTDFATIWPSLHPIYTTFKQQLKAKSLGYEGMIQREAVRFLREGNATHAPYEKYVFIGFNALTPCESYFFKSLQKQERAIFFWDYDDYYLANQWHEAGTFMRENLRRFPPEWNFDAQNLIDPSKHIEIISVPSDTGQAKLAGQILEKPHPLSPPHKGGEDGASSLSCGEVWERTAVVLPDEHLLLPMLSSLPEAARDINITMGYPFTYSPANSLFERLASLQKHIRIYSDGPRFYHHDVCMILYHPYIRDIIPDVANSIIKSIIEHNRIYVPSTEISGHALLQHIFVKCAKARDFSEYLPAIVSEIVAHLSLAPPPDPPQERNGLPSPEKIHANGKSFQLEYLYTLYTTLQRIRDVLAADDIDMDVQVFCRLLRKVFASLKIPFSGEPLKGLQLMGMLETRALDFDHVIILSMNEGVFPKGSPKQSFIPYNLRKGFGLTTSERYDAVSAYHFYRLIQRASNVRLIYNSAATDRNTGEMSRFLSQLVYEPAFDVQQRNITFRVNIDRDIPIVKERTDDVRRILNMYLAECGEIRQLSPSALNSYLDCRLRFYFRYIDGLTEPNEVTDEIDQSVFGKLLHKTLELIYSPFLSKEITKSDITRLQKDKQSIQQALLRAFTEDYFYAEQITDSDITGRNIIIREVLLKYVMRILEVDRDITPFTILSLEKQMKVRIPIFGAGNVAHLNMHGYIDRMDHTHNTLRIIDYKTGNARRNFASIADLFDRSKTGNHAVLQTLVYAYMTHIDRGKEYPRISSSLYIMKELFSEKHESLIYMSYQPPIDNYFDVAEEFEAELNQLLAEMFLSDMPFTQTDDPKKCLTCLYADICHRKKR